MAAAVLVAARAPLLLLSPRLMAEEASVHLAYALSHGLLPSLLLVPTAELPAGYLNLGANLAVTLAARLLPLEQVPTLVTACAFALHLLPVVVVLWGRSYFWKTPSQRLLCGLLLVVAPAARPSVWLTVINSQIFCGLAAFLISCEDLRGAGIRRIWTYRILLVFCGLTGAYTAFLALPFLLRSFMVKQREAALQCVLVAGAGLLQFALYVFTMSYHALAPERLGSGSLPRLPIAVLVQHLLQPIVGNPAATLLERALSSRIDAGAGWLAVAALLIFAVWLGRQRWEGLYALFPVTIAAVSVLTAAVSYKLPHERYAVLSGMIVSLALLAAASYPRPSRTRRVCRVLLSISLVVGTLTYRRDAPIGPGAEGFQPFGHGAGRPEWSQEVARWRQDPRYALRVWPFLPDRAWRAPLPRLEDFEALRGPLAAATDFHLVPGPEASELRVALPLLPADFRILIRGKVEDLSRRPRLFLILEDGDGRTVAQWAISGVRKGERFNAHFTPSGLEAEADRDLAEVRGLVLRAESRDGKTSVIAVERITILPRIEGLLDGLLPARLLPTGLYHAGPRPLVCEATPVLALESLIRDRDLVYATADEARATERWRHGPQGLVLTPDGRYDVGWPYLLVALPAMARAGPKGMVALNAVLFLVLAVLAWRDARPLGRSGRCFALGSLFAAAGFGFIFLPESRVFEMFCLYIPVRLWIRGRLTTTPIAFVGGAVLLAAAMAQDVLWAGIVAAVVIDLTFHRRGRAKALAFAALAVTVATALCFGPRFLERRDAGVIPAETAASYVAPMPPDVFERVSEAWRFYTARQGLIAYPFVLLALALFVRAAGDRPRLLLFVALAVVTGWIAWSDASTALATPLGSARFASIYPLFALLIRERFAWQALLLPAGVAVVVSLGVMSSAWTP